MKKIAAMFIVVSLSGCSVLDLWPRDHDPALVTKYVDLQVSLEKATCESKQSFDEPIRNADWLDKYAKFRGDPQVISTTNVLTNLKKAKEASDAACKRWLNLANINMKNIKESWSAR